jgi:uncharacterized protein
MNEKKLKRILSLDGGGIRGILTGQILVALEDKLNKKYVQLKGVHPEKPLRLGQYFDMISGTSTGGILTCILLCPSDDDPNYPKFTAKQAVDLYEKNGKTIFKRTFSGKLPGFLSGIGGSKYGRQTMEELLKSYFGNRMLSELMKPCLITSYDIQQRRAVFFTQHDALDKDNANFPIWQVARSTSAAPSYFPPAQAEAKDSLMLNTIDGGLFANNPTMCAMIEALKVFSTDKNDMIGPDALFIVSIGTGEIKKAYSYSEAVKWGILRWIAPIIDIMMTGVSETVHYQLNKLYKTMGHASSYYRILPELGEASPDMDVADDNNIFKLKQAGLATALKYDDELEEIATKLIQNS